MTKHRSDQVCGDTKYDPLTPRLRDGLPCKPGLATFPLLLDLVPVRTLVRILQPSRFFRILMEKKAPKEGFVWEACSLFGPDSLLHHGPVGFNLPNRFNLHSFQFKEKESLKTSFSLLKREKNFLKGSRAETAPLPCENDARKMRTFFTRRLGVQRRGRVTILRGSTPSEAHSSLLKTKILLKQLKSNSSAEQN